MYSQSGVRHNDSKVSFFFFFFSFLTWMRTFQTDSRTFKIGIIVRLLRWWNLQVVILSWNFAWILGRHAGFENVRGQFFPTPLCPYMGMPHYGLQGQRIKIQTLSNVVILYTIWTEILFWTTFVRTLYSENQPFSSCKPKYEGNWRYLTLSDVKR